MKPGPQSETFHADRYGFPLGLGIVLMCVASLGAAVALAVQAMRPK